MVSGNRALGSIITESKKLKSLGVNTCKNIIETGVYSIITWFSGIGFR